MKILKLIIRQVCFDQILAGTKTQEFREIKPTTYKKYIHYLHEGIVYETADKVPPEGDIEVVPIKYDAIQLYVGYNKNRDSALVEVKGAVVEFFIDENGENIEYEYKGEVYVAAQIVYDLGRVLEKNIH